MNQGPVFLAPAYRRLGLYSYLTDLTESAAQNSGIQAIVAECTVPETQRAHQKSYKLLKTVRFDRITLPDETGQRMDLEMIDEQYYRENGGSLSIQYYCKMLTPESFQEAAVGQPFV